MQTQLSDIHYRAIRKAEIENGNTALSSDQRKSIDLACLQIEEGHYIAFANDPEFDLISDETLKYHLNTWAGNRIMRRHDVFTAIRRVRSIRAKGWGDLNKAISDLKWNHENWKSAHKRVVGLQARLKPQHEFKQAAE